MEGKRCHQRGDVAGDQAPTHRLPKARRRTARMYCTRRAERPPSSFRRSRPCTSSGDSLASRIRPNSGTRWTRVIVS
jgi:hypothetical protein